MVRSLENLPIRATLHPGVHLHPQLEGMGDRQGGLPELGQVVADEMEPARFQNRHHRGDDEAGNLVRVDADHLEQAVVADGQFVGGTVMARLQPPTTHQLVVFINTADGMGVADIHSKEHATTLWLKKETVRFAFLRKRW